MSIVGLDENNISSFLENFVDAGIKITDELDLFEDDGLFASLPYGKIVNYFTKKAIQIADPSDALKKAVAVAVATNFICGIEKFNITFKIDDQDNFDGALHLIRGKLKRHKADVKEFNVDNFNDNDIVKKYVEDLEYIFNKYLNSLQINQLAIYRTNYLKLNFFQIIESQSTVYEKLSNVFKSKSYLEHKKIYSKYLYLEKIKNLYNDVVLNDELGMTLADIYVEPNFKIHEYSLSQDFVDTIRNKDAYRSESFFEISKDSVHDFIYDIVNDKKLEQLRNSYSNLYFVLGYPGQGKSSFCKKLINDIVVHNKVRAKELVFLKIRNITDTQSLINSPIETIYEEWIKEYDLDVENFPVRSLNNSLIVLDGLDELFIQENLTVGVIDEFCKSIIRKVEGHSKMKVLITSRYGYINIDNLKKTNSLIIQLDEFNESQEFNWLEKYKIYHPETNLTIDKIKLYNKDESYSAIKELITQPILLHLIATLNQEVEQNTNRSTIYDQLFTELINRSWAKEGQIDILSKIEKEDLREFIRDIAYAIFLSRKQYIHKSQLVELPETKVFITKLGNQTRDVLKNIMIAFYFQETKKSDHDKGDDRSDYAIEFLHKSLQEYLVAEKIWEEFQRLIAKESKRYKYLIDNASDAIRIIDELLPDVSMPSEIGNNLVEIVRNAQQDIKVELAERLELYFPEWIKNGFIHSFKWGEVNYNSKSREMINIIFSVLVNLVDGRNFLREKDVTEMLSEKNLSICLKDQIISGSVVNALDPDEEPYFNGIYNSNMLLEGSEVYEQTMNSKIENIQLDECEIAIFDNYSVEINNCIIHDTKFSLHGGATVVSFNNCSLFNSKFLYGKITFVNSIFTGCTFDIRSKMEFSNCTFEMCTFYILDTFDKSLAGNNIDNCAFLELSREKYKHLYELF